jgi:hypothetical protein
MTFAIDDALLPATLTAHPMTDEEFMVLCAEHSELNFEMTADGELIVMAPTPMQMPPISKENTFSSHPRHSAIWWLSSSCSAS